MSERKIINKYFPPDFDPEKLISRKRFLRVSEGNRRRGGERPKKVMNVRMMFPFTVCCNTCNEFTYIGTKFNSRVEKVEGEDYLGIVIWRFYAKCPNCRAEMSFKTDPKNADYIMEYGGVRTYDAQRDRTLAEGVLQEKMAAELEGDAMKQLEAKTYDTANELLALEQLDELRRINKGLFDRDKSITDALSWLKDEQEGGGKTTHDHHYHHQPPIKGPPDKSQTTTITTTRGHSSSTNNTTTTTTTTTTRPVVAPDEWTEEEKIELEVMRKDALKRRRTLFGVSLVPSSSSTTTSSGFTTNTPFTVVPPAGGGGGDSSNKQDQLSDLEQEDDQDEYEIIEPT